MEQKFKIIGAVIFLALAAWLGLFLYNKYNAGNGINPNPTIAPGFGQLPASATKQDEKEVKTLAENFVRIYKTYQLGDFSGLESLKDQMTAKLWLEKAEWIAAKKQEIKNQPKRYITYSALLKSSKIIFSDKDTIEIEVNYIQRETKGAMLQGQVTIKYVNEFGEEKAIPPPIETSEKIRLWFTKEGSEWKVYRIE